VLSGGSAVSMPWLYDVKAVLNGLLLGQAGGGATFDVLTGKVNPSGKLSETYPLNLEDTPARNNFPGTLLSVEYRESIFIGYRYYDKTEKDVLFPFGFGLSYTTFEYSDIKLSSKSIKDTDTVTVSFKIKNTGKRDGAEVAQVYVASPESKIFKAPKELKGFKKIFLKSGEEKEVSIELSKRSFAFYNVNINDWHVETGEYKILVGASSKEIYLTDSVKVTSSINAEVPDYRVQAPVYYTGDMAFVTDDEFTAILGHEIPESERDMSLPIDKNCTLEYADGTIRGEKITKLITAVVEKIGGGGINSEMMKNTAFQIPLRCFVTMSSGVFNDEMCDALCDVLNDKPLTPSAMKLLKNIPSALMKLPDLFKSM
jgi:beta-glucosidase